LLVALATSMWTPASLAQLTNHQSPLTPFGKALPGRPLHFPRDYGSHPEYRVEWWYVTGVLGASGGPLGFQITFFRARPAHDTHNPSRFAPRQILIGHAALSDPRRKRLLHQQRVAREGFGLAEAREERTAVWIDRWRLEQTDAGYRIQLPLAEFGYDLELRQTQPPMLNGEQGYSRKGPRPESASYYYSVPRLAVSGTVSYDGRDESVSGKAWLDHEWSSSYLDERAQGWDWIGINLDDGGALMAFRMRAHDGTAFWAGATLRTADGAVHTYGPRDVTFTPARLWQSTRTGTRYPVAWQITVGARSYSIVPSMDDQEQDARTTTGTVYWEGVVELQQDGKRAGAGSLELTGYWRRLKL
jgi:predicted secreted hydrolase